MNAPIRIYVPRDAAALAVDADAVARAIEVAAEQRGLAVQLVRNGSRGLLWLEPMVEIATPAGRVAYGPVQPEDVAGLFEAGWLQGDAHPLRLGPTEDILPEAPGTPDLRPRRRDRPAVAAGLRRARRPGGTQARTVPGARGHRPGTHRFRTARPWRRGLPTGIKWKTVAGTPADQKYIVCNADEGDSGTYADRLLMEGDPYVLIEGMTIAGLAVGATQGYIYVRSEYPHAIAALEAAIARAREVGWLGADVHGSGRRFDLEVRKGAGAYICGEETSLLESLEGKRGVVRAKPLPAISGLFGKPTVINNVISLATVPIILAKGAAYYRDYGVGRSHGTLPFQLAGNLKHGGLVEKAFGLTLRDLLYGFGGGSASGRPLRAVQVGGPLGAYLPESQWDVPLDYEAYARISAMIGHGGLVAFDDTVDMARMARYAMEFCAVESCGKCTPCRIGSTRGVRPSTRSWPAARRANSRCICCATCATPCWAARCARWAAWRRTPCCPP